MTKIRHTNKYLIYVIIIFQDEPRVLGYTLHHALIVQQKNSTGKKQMRFLQRNKNSTVYNTRLRLCALSQPYNITA